MRKILSIFILSVLLVGLTIPVLVGAQGQTVPAGCYLTKDGAKWSSTARCPDPTADGAFCDPSTDEGADCGMCCLLNIIYLITDWIFYIMIIAVVIVFVIAGAWFMLAGGDVEKTGKAKGLMILGVVGLAIALLAKLIPSVVKLLVGM